MLGRVISDPDGLEGQVTPVAGLGLLDVETVMQSEKQLGLVTARFTPTDVALSGYEIHLGETTGPDCGRGWLRIKGRQSGAASTDGRVRGCYLHGLFSSDAFRHSFLQELGHEGSATSYDDTVEATLNALADHLELHLDIDGVLAQAGKIVPA